MTATLCATAWRHLRLLLICLGIIAALPIALAIFIMRMENR